MRRLFELVAEVLGVEHDGIGPETGPLTLPQWDSLNHMRLVAAVEETYGIELSTDEITELLSVSDILDLLRVRGVHVD